jgi:hypothetical protein
MISGISVVPNTDSSLISISLYAVQFLFLFSILTVDNYMFIPVVDIHALLRNRSISPIICSSWLGNSFYIFPKITINFRGCSQFVSIYGFRVMLLYQLNHIDGIMVSVLVLSTVDCGHMICSRWNYLIERTPEMFYIFGAKSRDITPE